MASRVLTTVLLIVAAAALTACGAAPVRATKELDAAVPPEADNLECLCEAHDELPGDV